MSQPGRSPNASNAAIERRAIAMFSSSENWARNPPAARTVEPLPSSACSSSRTSETPASARWNAALVPTTPPPTITTDARSSPIAREMLDGQPGARPGLLSGAVHRIGERRVKRADPQVAADDQVALQPVAGGLADRAVRPRPARKLALLLVRAV